MRRLSEGSEPSFPAMLNAGDPDQWTDNLTSAGNNSCSCVEIRIYVCHDRPPFLRSGQQVPVS